MTTKLPRIPNEMGDHDFAPRHNPPPIGEDNTDLAKDLGYTEEQIEKLTGDGVVATGIDARCAIIHHNSEV